MYIEYPSSFLDVLHQCFSIIMGGTNSTFEEENYQYPVDAKPAVTKPLSTSPATTIIHEQSPSKYPKTTPTSSKNIAIKGSNNGHHSHSNRNTPTTEQGMRYLNSYTLGATYGNQPVKIVILGCASVGKASFVNRNVKGEQRESRGTTEIVFKTMLLKSSNITFQIVVCTINTQLYAVFLPPLLHSIFYLSVFILT